MFSLSLYRTPEPPGIPALFQTVGSPSWPLSVEYHHPALRSSALMQISWLLLLLSFGPFQFLFYPLIVCSPSLLPSLAELQKKSHMSLMWNRSSHDQHPDLKNIWIYVTNTTWYPVSKCCVTLISASYVTLTTRF